MSEGVGSGVKTYTRPCFSRGEAAALLGAVWGVDVSEESLRSLPSYDDQNFAVEQRGEGDRDRDRDRAVLKLFHAEESENTLLLQDAVMKELRRCGVLAPFARPTLTGETFVREPRGHLARLLDWVPGHDWCTMDLPSKLAVMHQVGELNGRIDSALKNVRTPQGAEFRHWVWRTSDCLLLRHYRWAVEKRQSAARLAIFDSLLEQFEKTDLTNCSEGVVHNDINDHNTLHDNGRISGVIDLGDCCFERHAFSLGNTLFYMLLTLPLEHVLSSAKKVVEGYLRHNPLPRRELEIAWLGAKLRCLTSATMSGATQEKHPDDPYVGETEKPGWNLLDYIYSIPFYE